MFDHLITFLTFNSLYIPNNSLPFKFSLAVKICADPVEIPVACTEEESRFGKPVQRGNIILNIKPVIVHLLTVYDEKAVNFKEIDEFKLMFGHRMHSCINVIKIEFQRD